MMLIRVEQYVDLFVHDHICLFNDSLRDLRPLVPVLGEGGCFSCIHVLVKGFSLQALFVILRLVVNVLNLLRNKVATTRGAVEVAVSCNVLVSFLWWLLVNDSG